MLVSVLRTGLLFSATAAEKAEPATGIVVAIGLTLVFAILVLLTIILVAEGKIFASLDKRKEKKNHTQQPPEAVPVERVPVQAATTAPVVSQGIPPEVVAAITAAVANIEGGKYTLRSVTATQKGRGQWGLAGVISYTEPF